MFLFACLSSGQLKNDLPVSFISAIKAPAGFLCQKFLFLGVFLFGWFKLTVGISFSFLFFLLNVFELPVSAMALSSSALYLRMSLGAGRVLSGSCEGSSGAQHWQA